MMLLSRKNMVLYSKYILLVQICCKQIGEVYGRDNGCIVWSKCGVLCSTKMPESRA